VALAEQCGYTGAGTVEFLLDNATGEFYFLEMNTRLQVEHPVTEEVVRVRTEGESAHVDLVELQLLVATGAPLPFAQDAITLDGHAIEARIYAEDSFHGFLPQAGIATEVSWPGEFTAGLLAPHVVRTGGDYGLPVIRVDHALESGQEVSTSYDPMLGKVITWGSDREAARAALVDALDATVIRGLTTNTGFLRVLAASAEFRDASIDTAWLDRHEVAAPEDAVARILAAIALVPEAAGGPGAARDPWQADGFRLGADPAPLVVEVDRPVVVGDGVIDGRAVTEEGSITAYGSPYTAWAQVEGVRQHASVTVTSATIEVVHQGQRFVFVRHDPFADTAAAAGDGTLLAPMPGTVLAINVAEGQGVAEGETLGVMEAMKMELALKAPFAGTVATVGAAAGDLVKLGAVLFVVEGSDD
jgi:acetyl/propionyl-CoA carboxylase alpha subunit